MAWAANREPPAVTPLFLFRTSATLPGAPTATYDGNTFGGLGAWGPTPPQSIPAGTRLYLSSSIYDPATSTLMPWSQPIQFSGEDGAAAQAGRYHLFLFQAAAAAPATPTATYDGAALAGLGAWTQAVPAVDADERLYLSLAEWVPSTSTLGAWSSPIVLSGRDGQDGQGGGGGGTAAATLTELWDSGPQTGDSLF